MLIVTTTYGAVTESSGLVNALFLSQIGHVRTETG